MLDDEISLDELANLALGIEDEEGAASDQEAKVESVPRTPGQTPRVEVDEVDVNELEGLDDLDDLVDDDENILDDIELTPDAELVSIDSLD